MGVPAMVTRVVEFIHRNGLILGFILYLSVLATIGVCGFLLKWRGIS
jgi:hypothetical protein